MFMAMTPKEVLAREIFLKNNFEPLDSFPGAKIGWKSKCLITGKVVSPTLSKVKDRGHVCGYCSGKKIDLEDVITLFESRGFEFIGPFVKSHTPIKVKHLICGNTVQVSFANLKNYRGSGCKYCSRTFVDAKQAEENVRKLGFEPIEKYVKSSIPWKMVHLKCGNTVSPTYSSVTGKSNGLGCSFCGGSRPISKQDAFSYFRSRGLEPIGNYKNSRTNIDCLHPDCGMVLSLSYSALSNNENACKFCAGLTNSEADAIKTIISYGFSPLEKFPGSSKKWRVRHNICGNEKALIFTRMKRALTTKGNYVGCLICTGNKKHTNTEVREFMKSMGFKMLENYVDSATPINAVHIACGKKATPTYNSLRRGGINCGFCSGKQVDPREAVKFMKSSGYIPQEEYKYTTSPWKCIHKKCGNVTKPTYNNIKRGLGGCRYCATWGIDFKKKTILYLISHPQMSAHKIGINNFDSGRLEKHLKNGWVVYKTMLFKGGLPAYEVEQSILDWLRNECDLQMFLLPTQMPQGGHTETVDASEIDLVTIWEKVQELSKVKR